MNLIKRSGVPVFKEKQGFKYPDFWDFYKQHLTLHWTIEEVSLADDVLDFKKASEKEKDVITKVMQLFTQNEVMVGRGYATLLNIFKPIEVVAMLSEFNSREMIHIDSYSKFTETIGIEDSVYTEFLNEPLLFEKTGFVDKARVKKHHEYTNFLTQADADKQFRHDIALMLAVYGGFTELVSLYAQFAMLLSFQFENKYKGLCTIVQFSIKDEYHHGTCNTELFKAFIQENKDIWNDDLKRDIYGAGREVVAYELALIDYINPEHINKELLKNYVKYCANEALKGMGLKAEYPDIYENPFPFMDAITSAVKEDFFSGRVTEYNKGFSDDDIEISYEKWRTNDT